MARYLFASQNKRQKRKTEEKETVKEKRLTWLLAQLVAPSPSPPPPLCRLPQASTQGAAWRPCHGRRRAPGHLLLLPRHLFVPRDAQKPSRSILPLHELPPRLPRPISSPPEDSPERATVEDAADVR